MNNFEVIGIHWYVWVAFVLILVTVAVYAGMIRNLVKIWSMRKDTPSFPAYPNRVDYDNLVDYDLATTEYERLVRPSKEHQRDLTEREESRFAWGAATALATVSGLGIGLGALAPFNPDVWTIKATEGTVTNVSNTFQEGSGDISVGYVVQLDTLEDTVVVEDPRILNENGNHVSLSCTTEWVPYAQDRLNCNIM